MRAQVTVYDGPKECADTDKVTAGRHLSMHYTGKIDASSKTGEQVLLGRTSELDFHWPKQSAVGLTEYRICQGNHI
jgi:hypothetical protein